MASAFLDDDAKAYYDRIVTRLSKVKVRKWGVSKQAAKFTTKFLHNQELFLKLASGVTKKSHQYSDTSRIQGSGPSWTVSSDTISNIMAEKYVGMRFSDPTNTIEIKRNGSFFVNDLDIGVTKDAILEKSLSKLECLQSDKQIYSLLLNGIEYCLDPIKMSYYYIRYKRDGLRHMAMSIAENPGNLDIQVEFGGEMKRIKRLEPHMASKALGVF